MLHMLFFGAHEILVEEECLNNVAYACYNMIPCKALRKSFRLRVCVSFMAALHGSGILTMVLLAT